MSECKQCNQKPVSKGQYLTIIFGVYLLGSSIYGTIQIIKNLNLDENNNKLNLNEKK